MPNTGPGRPVRRPGAEHVPVCDECGQKHIDQYGHPGCPGHVYGDRASYVKGQPRKRLDTPLPCRRAKGDKSACSMHGVNQRTRAAAQRLEQQRKAGRQLSEAMRAAYGDDVPDMPPAEAMLKAVSWTAAEVAELRRRVADLPNDERVWSTVRNKIGGDDAGMTEEARPNVWWVMLNEKMRDLVKFSAAARAAGCDEARVKIAEQQGQMLADVIKGILGDMNLTPEQEAMISVVVPRHLRAVAS